MTNSLQPYSEMGGYRAPRWISIALACIFALQWTFTMLPHTLAIRNFCYVIGAILGAYILAKNFRLLLQKNALPIWLVLLLFVWMTIHLLFIGTNHELQIAEFESLWKRAVLGVIFAIGFGISISILCSGNRSDQEYTIEWRIVVAGLWAPTIIYYIKFIASNFLPKFGINAPIFLKLFYGSAEFYVAKIAYVFFCLPLLAIALGMLTVNSHKSSATSASVTYRRCFWMFSAIAVMGLFICENIKNGIMYTAVLMAFFLILVLKNWRYKSSKSYLVIIAAVFLAGVIFIVHNIRSNPSWGTLLADYEVATHISPAIVWKTQDPYYESNYGATVSGTNFDRFFFATTAFHLLEDNLLGYGLVQSSFGHLARELWPNAPLIQSHSGWLDLSLGLGVPGVLLIFLGGCLSIRNVAACGVPWSIFGVWGLASILLLYMTTEVAQKNYLDTFIWFIAFVASLSLPSFKKPI